MAAFYRGAVAVPLSGNHEDVLPVVADDPLCTWSYPIYNQDIHTVLSIEGIAIFTEADEDLVEDLITHLQHLLEQLGFERGGPHPLARMESMEDIAEMDRRPNLEVDYPQHQIT